MQFDKWQGTNSKNKQATSDWDAFDPQHSQQNSSVGGIHWLLALVSFVFTSSTSFLIAWLLRDIPSRSIFQLGLMFMAPVVIMLFTALLLEYKTSKMTPWCSRRLQVVLAFVASAVVFIVSCLAQLSYVNIDIQQPNYIFLVDKSSSMGMGSNVGTDMENQRSKSLKKLMDNLKDGTVVGLVLFNHEVQERDCLGPARLDANVRDQYVMMLARNDDGSTNFALPLDKALEMIEGNKDITGGRTTRIIILTDGDPNTNGSDITDYNEPSTLFAKCKKYNATVSCVKIGGEIRSELLNELINSTKGISLTVDTADELAQGLTIASTVKGGDVLQVNSPEAKWICGALFFLTGLAIGIGLSLMLSRQHQFRFQLILSPLSGLTAFLIILYLPGLTDWFREGIAFSAYGLVFMKMNRALVNSHEDLEI